MVHSLSLPTSNPTSNCGHDTCENIAFYPQSNGKLERFHGTLKQECIRPQTPLCLDDAIRSVTIFVDHYNNERLHSAIGYVAPKDNLNGLEEAIFSSRKRKLSDAKLLRESHQKGGQQAALTLGKVALAEAILNVNNTFSQSNGSRLCGSATCQG